MKERRKERSELVVLFQDLSSYRMRAASVEVALVVITTKIYRYAMRGKREQRAAAVRRYRSHPKCGV